MSVKNILSDWVWQLPQNLLGIIWKRIKKESVITSISNDDIRSVDAEAYLMKAGGAVTLGKYMFISQVYEDREMTVKHECGHVRQSEILGPLYLMVIGVPSILHAWINGYIGCCEKHEEGYCHFYTEHILMGEFDVGNK